MSLLDHQRVKHVRWQLWKVCFVFIIVVVITFSWLILLINQLEPCKFNTDKNWCLSGRKSNSPTKNDSNKNNTKSKTETKPKAQASMATRCLVGSCEISETVWSTASQPLGFLLLSFFMLELAPHQVTNINFRNNLHFNNNNNLAKSY